VARGSRRRRQGTGGIVVPGAGLRALRAAECPRKAALSPEAPLDFPILPAGGILILKPHGTRSAGHFDAPVHAIARTEGGTGGAANPEYGKEVEYDSGEDGEQENEVEYLEGCHSYR